MLEMQSDFWHNAARHGDFNMEEEDFESVESGTAVKKTVGSLMPALDGEIESALNGKIDFSNLEIDDDFATDSRKVTKNDEDAMKATESMPKCDSNPEKRDSADDEAERRLNAIIDEFNEDVKIEIGNIREKAMMEPSLRGKWIRKYILAKAKEKRLKSGIEVLRDEISKMYASKGSFLASRQSVDAAVKNDKGIKELKRELYIESQLVEVLSYCKDTIYGFGYSVKNSLDAMKLDAGI